jgi:hypothetical protein
MKLFIAVILAAIVIGGFVGAELMDSSFSITGAVVGGVGTAAVLLGLGAFFDAQERKRKEKALPPEMRAVFDRMFGKDTSSRPQHSKPAPRPQTQRPVPPPQKSFANPQEVYLSTTSGLIAVKLMPKYSSPKEAFGALMTNKRASGYLFGFHDSLLQRIGLYDPSDKNNSVKLMEKSYKNLFGEQAGYALFSSSLHFQDDPGFVEGRMNGGNEIVQYLEEKVPPLGLGRILILGMEA